MRLQKILDAVRSGRPPAVGDLPGPLVSALASVCHARGRFSRLSSLERLLTCLRHKEPDRVPVTPILNSGARQILGVGFREYSQDPCVAADVLHAGYKLVGGDLMVLLMDLSVEAEAWGQKIIYPENSTARPDYSNPLIKDASGYEKLKPARFETAARMNAFVRTCELLVGKVGFSALVTGFVFGPLGVLSMMRGAEPVFKDCINHPAKVRKACEAITETLLEFTQAQCDAGVAGVAIDSLYASWSGVPKKTWEAIEGPFCSEIAAVARKNGMVVGIHNCGHGPYFDSQIKFMEPDVISFGHLPDDCKTAAEMKRRYGGQVTLLGHVPTPLLAHGTPQQVMDECQRQIEALGKDGGYILAPACEYPPNISLTSAFALVRAAEGRT